MYFSVASYRLIDANDVYTLLGLGLHTFQHTKMEYLIREKDLITKISFIDLHTTPPKFRAEIFSFLLPIFSYPIHTANDKLIKLIECYTAVLLLC